MNARRPQPQSRPELTIQVPRGIARLLGDLAKGCQRYPLRPLPGMRGVGFSWLAALTLAVLSTLDQLTDPHATRSTRSRPGLGVG